VFVAIGVTFLLLADAISSGHPELLIPGQQHSLDQSDTIPQQPGGSEQSSDICDTTPQQPGGSEQSTDQPEMTPQQPGGSEQSTDISNTTPQQPRGSEQSTDQPKTTLQQPGAFIISPRRVFAKNVLADLYGPVKAVTARTRKRKAEKATVLTSSPYKKLLEEKERNKAVSHKKNDKGLQGEQDKNRKGQSVGLKKVRKKMPKASCKERSGVKCICGVIEGSEGDTDGWIQCNMCNKWLHEHCAELNGIFDDDFFYCSTVCMQ